MSEENKELEGELTTIESADGGALAAPGDLAALVAQSESKFATDQALATVTKSGDYLPYIVLMGSSSSEVKKGEFPMGHFALRRGKGNLHDLGTQFTAVVIGWRPKAMQYVPDVISFFDHESKEFKEIQAGADAPNSGKGYGPEFLIWLPELKEFVTYFMGNKTGRNESSKVMSVLKKAASGETPVCVIEAYLIEGRENSWHGPRTLSYDLGDPTMPTGDQLAKEIKKFNDPPAAQKQVAEAAEEAEGSRR